ncbi:MAG: hypothetical protein ACKVRP_00055 [Bacteroidota bacterium]
MKAVWIFGFAVAMNTIALSGERSIVSLTGFCSAELKMAGLELPRQTTFRIKALGGGGDNGWSYKSDEMFAYGWIINATSRELVWKMDTENTRRSKDDRSFDDNVTLDPGSYEVYFTVPAFSYHTTFTHMTTNVDHREKTLFGQRLGDEDKNFFKFFEDWWSEDIAKDWEKRCNAWGMEMMVDEVPVSSIKTFKPSKEMANTVLKATGVGEGELVRKGFSLSEPATLYVYALGEGVHHDDPVDCSWIVNASTRELVWEMNWKNAEHAGGAEKNIKTAEDVDLPKGDYVLYCITDDSHSSKDWNSAPCYDPLNYGATLVAKSATDASHVRSYQYQELRNVIVSLVKVRDSESRSEGFTLRQDAMVRVYAFGERSNSRRLMADYGVILDARTRNKVWSMDVDRSRHAGGASKNRYVDEVIKLPRGSYVVTYNTDDSHAYGDWNSTRPFDQENYGITIMGVDANFTMASIEKYADKRDKNIIAQIVRARDDADKVERFKLEKTTKIRVYAIGEGQNREMYDYGWIEDVNSGNIVWEMTYGMTFHAGGHRKNRMVNTTILLDKGEYKLHYVSDDSHSYNDWNVDPPEDQEYWGITLYKDEGLEIPAAPQAPPIPRPPDDEE